MHSYGSDGVMYAWWIGVVDSQLCYTLQTTPNSSQTELNVCAAPPSSIWMHMLRMAE